MSRKYAVIFEPAQNNWAAYVPDLPGCVAVGETKDEVLGLIREAIELHLESLRENGEWLMKTLKYPLALEGR